ncbi:hypothetical protein IWQ56_004361, partial [Coemansia nantahalensis]
MLSSPRSPELHARDDPDLSSGSRPASPADSSGGDTRQAFLTRRTMSINSLAAERAFVDSIFDQEGDAHPGIVPAAQTPRSILMSQRLGQAHAGAVLAQMSPHTAAQPADVPTMPPLALGSPAAVAAAAVAATTALHPDGDGDDDEAMGRRLEKELRSLMMRTSLDAD